MISKAVPAERLELTRPCGNWILSPGRLLTSYAACAHSSTAGNGIFTNNGGTNSGADDGATVFNGTATAANATLIANGGSNGGTGGAILFTGDSTGGTARVEVFDNGNLDISAHNAPGVTVGSIEGTG